MLDMMIELYDIFNKYESYYYSNKLFKRFKYKKLIKMIDDYIDSSLTNAIFTLMNYAALSNNKNAFKIIGNEITFILEDNTMIIYNSKLSRIVVYNNRYMYEFHIDKADELSKELRDKWNKTVPLLKECVRKSILKLCKVMLVSYKRIEGGVDN